MGSRLVRHSITKTILFEAAHKLEGHSGKCARLHGHSYKAHITVERMAGDLINCRHASDDDMVIDFYDLKGVLDNLVENVLDHHYLNETLNAARPTAEYIAAFIFRYLQAAIGSKEDVAQRDTPEDTHVIMKWHSLLVKSVTVEETCTGSATYGI